MPMMSESQSCSTTSTRSSASPSSGPISGLSDGFSVVEMVVTVALFSMLTVGVLTLFDSSSLLSREQRRVAEMQQSNRVSQHEMSRFTRMAGRGGLPPNLAAAFRNDAGPGDTIAIGQSSSPVVVRDTDVLILRGVFETLFQTQGSSANLILDLASGTVTGGAVRVSNPSPSGVPQDLQGLIDAVTDQRSEALIMVDGASDETWAVVELNPQDARTDVSNPQDIWLAFRVAAKYQPLSAGGTFAPTMRTVASVGILEEWRYYVRAGREIPGDPTSRLQPTLGRDRFYPGTELPHPDPNDFSSLGSDLADGVIDLQLALGFDVDGDGLVLENNPPDKNDEWVGNASGDTALGGKLFYVRINTLARTTMVDLGHLSAPISDIEDHHYGETSTPSAAKLEERRHRRRLLQSTIDLRNVF